MQEIARRLDRESTAHMHDAFQAGVQDAGNPLTDWVDPGNTLRLLRLEHELRANADLRAEALLRRGALAEVDDRVQELADGLAVAIMDLLNQEAHAGGDALAADREQLANVASGVRALIAAGPDAARTAALDYQMRACVCPRGLVEPVGPGGPVAIDHKEDVRTRHHDGPDL